MNNLNILSGGAAQGLVGSLAPAFKAQTGFDIAGEFGAVGLMADKLHGGMPTDIVILTAALLATLAEERLVVAASISDVGLVETALAVRASDPKVVARDEAGLRDALLASDAIFVPDTKASTAGIHVAKVLARLGIADTVAARLKIDARTGGVRRAASDRLHPIDRNHLNRGRRPVRIAAAGVRTRDHVHGGRRDKGRPSVAGISPDRPVDRRRATRTARTRGLHQRPEVTSTSPGSGGSRHKIAKTTPCKVEWTPAGRFGVVKNANSYTNISIERADMPAPKPYAPPQVVENIMKGRTMKASQG